MKIYVNKRINFTNESQPQSIFIIRYESNAAGNEPRGETTLIHVNVEQSWEGLIRKQDNKLLWENIVNDKQIHKFEWQLNF